MAVEKNSAEEDQTSGTSSTRLGRMLLASSLAVLWVLFFYYVFYSQTLPNAQEMGELGRPTRWFVWQNVGEILLDDVLPIRDKEAPPSGWRYLPQRIPFLLIAFFVYVVAYFLGSGCLKWIGGNIKVMGRLEWHSLSLAMGLSGLSVLTLLLGVFGLLNRLAFLLVYAAVIAFWVFVHVQAAGSFAAWKGRVQSWFLLKYHKISNAQYPLTEPRVWGPLIIAPFLLAMALGAMLPSTDFDVKEYHFGGPKEYYLAGQIEMLPHNVYTSFPFLTEMLTLTGMVLYGDWYWGAIVGKTILLGFAPLTALLLYTLLKRQWGSTAGWLAVIVHLSIPWTYRISIIAYTEGGLSMFLAATLLAVTVTAAQLSKRKTAFPCVMCCGVLAGSAAACKYPGLISVTIPVALFLLAAYIRATRLGMRTWQQTGIAAATFVLGVLLTFGPWLAKNLVETGNPVYPLLYSVFGGADWDATLDAKWKAAHSPDHHQLGHLATSLADVFLINDWQSPLIGAFGLLGLVVWGRPSLPVRWWGIYLVWLFLTWWVLTHRIDRFWVPMLPVASALAAAGIYWLAQRTRLATAAILVPPLVYNLAFMTTGLSGYNAYLIDLHAARKVTAAITSPEVVFLNEYMARKSGRVLSVGEAELFDATFDYDYNTVFDRSLFAEWVGQPDEKLPEGKWGYRDPDVIRALFREREITEILVNWQEILRYRTTYGYTDFVTPQRFTWLQEQQLIGPPLANTPFYQEARTLSAQQREEIERWAPELLVTLNGTEYFLTTQIFPVL